jgi:hypothetical protein
MPVSPAPATAAVQLLRRAVDRPAAASRVAAAVVVAASPAAVADRTPAAVAVVAEALAAGTVNPVQSNGIKGWRGENPNRPFLF